MYGHGVLFTLGLFNTPIYILYIKSFYEKETFGKLYMVLQERRTN